MESAKPPLLFRSRCFTSFLPREVIKTTAGTMLIMFPGVRLHMYNAKVYNGSFQSFMRAMGKFRGDASSGLTPR